AERLVRRVGPVALVFHVEQVALEAQLDPDWPDRVADRLHVGHVAAGRDAVREALLDRSVGRLAHVGGAGDPGRVQDAEAEPVLLEGAPADAIEAEGDPPARLADDLPVPDAVDLAAAVLTR